MVENLTLNQEKTGFESLAGHMVNNSLKDEGWIGWRDNSFHAHMKRFFFCRFAHKWENDHDSFLRLTVQYPNYNVGMCKRRKLCWACADKMCPDE